jgi:Alcohol dehydrogenase, class IV
MTAAPMLRGDWLFPTEIRFGAGRIAELGDACRRLGLRRPLIVTDRRLAATPVAELVRDAARGTGVAPASSPRCRRTPRAAMSRRGWPPSTTTAPTA